ncbi:MAG: DUF2723 domain-containing protein [Bacteroidales bacterium]|nr:DUF2723 domain-containing protein [Bacteroidales bacterium]
MDSKQFNLFNRIAAALAFVVSAVTYLLTIEPSASFWDCGEFIASSYKLEVGHPPGNPVFQLFARIATLFGDASHAAVLVNALSAICSALTIFFLYLTIVWLVKRILKPSEEGKYTTGEVIAILGSGLVGALAYCFSDTFWFSAVEGEVYAMSSLFTALVFWAMTMWYDCADEPYANRWIVLIAFLMGLSIGIHLLNLLAIPAIVFMYYFRQKEDYTFWQYVKIFLVGVVILAVILFMIIPWLPKIAAYFDLFFVNVLGLGYNTGAAFFMIALLALCFWGIFKTKQAGKVFWNTVLLSFTVIVIGFSIFTVDIIRSAAKTPTNEYQPDNAFTLVRYLSREQYGKTPLIYGQYYDAPYDLKTTKYWAPMDGKYKKVDGPVDAQYKSAGKMLFPRMWSSSPDGKFENFYEAYTGGKGRKIAGAEHRKPTMRANLSYFFDYQMNWMYWRYFMWNFVGRQNDIHSPAPGNIFHGNWESGVKFIDSARLGDQTNAPGILKNNKGKNHYYFLPLLLGLLGLCFQFGRDKRGCWLTFLMFFMTGIAIVLYLNQPPYQVRERDYAYAGSFYFFSIWIGLAVAAIYRWVDEALKGKAQTAVSAGVAAVCLFVPVLMGAQNWDDHDRSNRRTAVELAANYLNSVGPNGFLITHGDNDTFPLWYAQEVESIRTDVRILNTSLLGTDWYIDQMKYACNESAPLPLSVPQSQYLYGTNEYVPIVDNRGTEMMIDDVMAVFRHPQLKVGLASGRKVDYIPSRKIVVPVNKENVLKYGIVPADFAEEIPESITLTIPKGKDYLTKPELFMLDLLAGYDWSRPINMLNQGGDINIGIKDYLFYEGFSYKLVPLKNKVSSLNAGKVDLDGLYNKLKNVYRFDALSADGWFVDYQNYYTHLGVMSIRQLFATVARSMAKSGYTAEAADLLDRGMEATRQLPLETIPIGFVANDYMVIDIISQYYKYGQKEKADALAEKLAGEMLETALFYYDFYDWAKDDFETSLQYLYYLEDEVKKGGNAELAVWIDTGIKAILGPEQPEEED